MMKKNKLLWFGVGCFCLSTLSSSLMADNTNYQFRNESTWPNRPAENDASNYRFRSLDENAQAGRQYAPVAQEFMPEYAESTNNRRDYETMRNEAAYPYAADQHRPYSAYDQYGGSGYNRPSSYYRNNNRGANNFMPWNSMPFGSNNNMPFSSNTLPFNFW